MISPDVQAYTPLLCMQVLLSQVHRLRALVLLGRFLDMGRWAVDLALSVGIFPYVLKLLQTTAPDLRQTLVFIWTKILALDKTCQVDQLPFAMEAVLPSTYVVVVVEFQAAAFLADECYGDEWVYALFLVLDAVMQLGWLALHPSACLEYLRPDQACFGTGHAVHFCITQRLIQHCTFVSSCFILLPFLVAI